MFWAAMSPSDDGANQVWGLISTLVAGPAVWGAIGYGVDRLLDTSAVLPIGVVVGFVTSFYIVYVKTSRQGPSS
jgi:F0F1-type ATP synthase assembly protein I